MESNPNITTERFKVGDDWHMIDHGGNHFVNGRCVNPKELPQSQLDLVYTTKTDEKGAVIGYASNKQQTKKVGSTYPPMEDRVYFKVLGHIPLEQRGTDKHGQPKMYVKRGYEHLIN